MENIILLQIGPQIKVANTLIEKELNSRMSQLFSTKNLNLTGPQITLLIYLYEAQNRIVTQHEISQRFVLSHPTIRSIVKRLASNKLINTTNLPNDRRQIVLSLSKQGNQLIQKNIDQIYITMKDINQQIVHNLTFTQKQQLTQILNQVINNFKK